MDRLIAGTLGLIGFGVILAEVVNNTMAWPIRIPPLGLSAALIIAFAINEVIASRQGGAGFAWQGKYFRIRDLFLSLLGLIALISIPFLWWGVIKKLAAMAKSGLDPF